MSATEKDRSTCLEPEAYMRIIQACKSDKGPKFRSSVYPKKDAPLKRRNGRGAQ